MVTEPATASRAWQILARVSDPEIPVVSVVDLGIVRHVDAAADCRRVTVVVTPTYSGCPATEVIIGDIRAALSAAYDEVDVRIQLSPAWTTDWLSPAGKAKLAEFGIAPPDGRATLPLLTVGAVPVSADLAGRPAACPHCGSVDTEELAAFGSTPCKALWRCRSCREPFDYFKVH